MTLPVASTPSRTGPSRVTTYTYDDASRISTIDRPGSLTTAYTYDEVDHPLTAETTRSGTAILSQAWTYDPDGNIATLTDDTGIATFTYDNLDRLLTASYPAGQNYTYTYDAVGNTLSAKTPTRTTTYTYGPTDRITSKPAGGTAPTYDGNGNMLTDGSYGGRTYTYDTLGRLSGVTVGGVTTTYSLDGSGNRWSQTTSGTTTNFDLDVVSPNATILSDGSHTYLPGSPGAGYELAGTWWNALTDLIGSPIMYVPTTGTATAPVHYDPFGAPRPGTTLSTGIGYAGEYRDATGLVNLRFRSYDPVLGRFIGRDTFGGVMSAPQTGNRYSYAGSNPLRYTDPSGRFANALVTIAPTVVELLLYTNVVTAVILATYELLTGTDPITGAKLDPNQGLFNFVIVIGSHFGLPILAKVGEALSGSFATELSIAERYGATALTGERFGAEVGVAERLGGEVGAVERLGGEAAVAERFGAEAGVAARDVRGGVTYGELDALGRPTGVTATIDRSMIGTGTGAREAIRPPGFGGAIAGQSRGHLLGAQLGGRAQTRATLLHCFRTRPITR